MILQNKSSVAAPTSAQTVALLKEIKEEWAEQMADASDADKELLAYVLKKKYRKSKMVYQ